MILNMNDISISCMASSSSVVELNNLGVDCIDSFDFVSAVLHLRQAVQLTLGHPSNLSRHENCADVFSESTQEGSISTGDQQFHTRHCFCFPSEPQQPAGSSPMSGQQHPQSERYGSSDCCFTSHAIYRNGIKFGDLPIPACAEHPVSKRVIESAIIVFNLAIIYHIHGERNPRMLLKAKSLYEKCTCLLFSAGCFSGHVVCSTGLPVLDLLSMALFNNMSQICFERSEYVALDRLIHILVEVINSKVSYPTVESNSTMRHFKSIFLLNVMELRVPDAASAA